ncbi:MAG: rhodanese-like domain-containing protein [Rhizobiaceae bacterium]
MNAKTYRQMAAEAAEKIREINPWDLPGLLEADKDVVLVDIREPGEFADLHISGSLSVPRGIMESAAEWDYAETEPELANARQKPVILICRSGNRSALAALVLGDMGFTDVRSVKLGLRGWNDADLPLVNASGDTVDGDAAAALIDPPLRPDQTNPARR